MATSVYRVVHNNRRWSFCRFPGPPASSVRHVAGESKSVDLACLLLHRHSLPRSSRRRPGRSQELARRRFARRRVAGLCGRCGYDLRAAHRRSLVLNAVRNARLHSEKRFASRRVKDNQPMQRDRSRRYIFSSSSGAGAAARPLIGPTLFRCGGSGIWESTFSTSCFVHGEAIRHQDYIEDSRTVETFWMARKPPDATAGELHDWVVRLCEAKGVKVPHSSWNRVASEFAKASQVTKDYPPRDFGDP